MKKNFKISISLQISIFLFIVMFIPVVVIMALNTYEKQQLSMLENSNVQQGRVLAAALCENKIDEARAKVILQNMNGQFDSRIRVLDGEGCLICDSATLTVAQKTGTESERVAGIENLAGDSAIGGRAAIEDKIERNARKSLIYRILSYPIRKYRKLFRPPVASLYDSADFYIGKNVFNGEEVIAALNGRYGAKTRISWGNQVSVTLYSAVPVFDVQNKVCGVVLVSRSTYKILQNLYELRLDFAKIFLKSLVAILLVAVFLAFRISFPLKKLARQTTECADKKGHILFTEFTGKNRHDEIGDLSRSFNFLIERLNKRIKFSQAFSSDISHEFKNPLAAIRTSAEVLSDSELDNGDREVLSAAIIGEVDHLQTLLNGVRNISRIDAGEDFSALEIPSIPVNDCVRSVIKKMQNKYDAVQFEFEAFDNELKLKIPEDYIFRIAENLIDNAASFGNKVKITSQLFTQKNNQNFIFTVEDNGCGISEESKKKIFDRFYSERAEAQQENHTGLGLSIVKSIVDVLEGQIEAGDSKELGGAAFKITLKGLCS